MTLRGKERRWLQLGDVELRFRGAYAYVEATMSDGYDQPPFPLEWKGRPDAWEFAVAARRMLSTRNGGVSQATEEERMGT